MVYLMNYKKKISKEPHEFQYDDFFFFLKTINFLKYYTNYYLRYFFFIIIDFHDVKIE